MQLPRLWSLRWNHEDLHFLCGTVTVTSAKSIQIVQCTNMTNMENLILLYFLHSPGNPSLLKRCTADARVLGSPWFICFSTSARVERIKWLDGQVNTSTSRKTKNQANKLPKVHFPTVVILPSFHLTNCCEAAWSCLLTWRISSFSWQVLSQTEITAFPQDGALLYSARFSARVFLTYADSKYTWELAFWSEPFRTLTQNFCQENNMCFMDPYSGQSIHWKFTVHRMIRGWVSGQWQSESLLSLLTVWGTYAQAIAGKPLHMEYDSFKRSFSLDFVATVKAADACWFIMDF